MNTRFQNNCRPNLESLEERQLLTANLAAHLPALLTPSVPAQQHVQPLNHGVVDYGAALGNAGHTASAAKGQSSDGTEYSAFSIANNTRFTLTFYVRWYDGTNLAGQGGHWTSWQAFTLRPGQRGEYWINRANPGCLVDTGETAQIYFASSTAGATRTYNLGSSVVYGRPASGAGTHYEFLPTSSTTLNLYRGG